jgi:hypothetical protein
MRNHPHLQRLMYSALAGLAAVILVVVLASRRHKALAAQAAAGHMSASHVTSFAALGLGAIVMLVIYIPWDIAAARRSDRMKRAIRMGGVDQGGGW